MDKRVWIFGLILFLAAPVLAEEKAIGLQATGLTTTSEGGQKWALVVGINQYSNVPALNYAAADAKALYESLIKAGFSTDNVMLMTDTAAGHLYPTRGNLRARIDQLATLAGKDDVLLVFFSGHGTEKNGAGYLVPIDGSTTDIGSLVPLSWVKETLETSAAKHRLLILDACHSGAKAGDAAASPADVMLSDLGGAAFATLSSCDIDQLSYEDKESGHGVFTSAIIDGLGGAADRQAQGNNDSVVNATELWAYAALKTKQWGLRTGKVQTPVLKGNFKGLIEITRFKSVEELKGEKEKLQKKLEMMEQLQRDSAAEELRKEISKLETQLNTIGGIDNVQGSDEVQLAYTKYDAAQKTVDELNTLLEEQSKIYQPTSTAITKIKERISAAQAELDTVQQEKYKADAVMYEVIQRQIGVKQSQYDELIKEMLSTAPQAQKLYAEICEMKNQQQGYQFAYYKVNPPVAGDVMTNSIGMKLVWIPAGSFMMGSESGSDNEKPVRTVQLTKGFWMGQYEVTQAEYEKVMGTNPSYFKGSQNPVEQVSWNDAMKFCEKLSQMDGKTYTLPTEAQWEYACRAGTTTAYCFGDSESQLGEFAWYGSNSGQTTHPVGQKKPNNFGLYDMHGNVWEWCLDWYHSYNGLPDSDPRGPESGTGRVLRGGGWNNSDTHCRSADRYDGTPGGASNGGGFRVVCLLDGGTQYISSKNEIIYHLQTCELVQQIKSQDVQFFNSDQAARDTGRQPCKRCLP